MSTAADQTDVKMDVNEMASRLATELAIRSDRFAPIAITEDLRRQADGAKACCRYIMVSTRGTAADIEPVVNGCIQSAEQEPGVVFSMPIVEFDGAMFEYTILGFVA